MEGREGVDLLAFAGCSHVPDVSVVGSFVKEVVCLFALGFPHSLTEGLEGGVVAGPLSMSGGCLGDRAGLVPPSNPFGVGHVAGFKVGSACGLNGVIECCDAGMEAFLGFLHGW